MSELMKQWSHREYRMRLAWLDAEWNRPDHHDNYLMQIAQGIYDVRRALYSKDPGHLELDKFRITFGPPVESSSEEEQGLVLRQSKSAWCAAAGIGHK